MASTPATNIEEIERIRGEMARIRRDLHENVQEAVEGARALTDVSSYFKNHLWIAAGAAAAVGYWLVPRPAPGPAATREEVRETVQSVMSRRDKAKAKASESNGSLMGTIFGLVAPIATRVAQGYAVGLVEDWIAARDPAHAGPARHDHDPEPASRHSP